jgi:DNA-directed RNA polymerase subunit K/omega
LPEKLKKRNEKEGKTMKFYDLDDLKSKCGTDNKYKITALVTARARWLSEQKKLDSVTPENEKYLSMALLEIEEGHLPREWVAGLEEIRKTPEELAAREAV